MQLYEDAVCPTIALATRATRCACEPSNAIASGNGLALAQAKRASLLASAIASRLRCAIRLATRSIHGHNPRIAAAARRTPNHGPVWARLSRVPSW